MSPKYLYNTVMVKSFYPNTADGSRGIVKISTYRIQAHKSFLGMPPTAVGGASKSCLLGLGLNNPPTPVGGI